MRFTSPRYCTLPMRIFAEETANISLVPDARESILNLCRILGFIVTMKQLDMP